MAAINWAEQVALNKKHVADPQVGDMWEDHLVKVLLVVDVTATHVFFVTTIMVNGWGVETYLTWNMKEPLMESRKVFQRRLHYSSNLSLTRGTWADVHPLHYLAEIERYKPQWKPVIQKQQRQLMCQRILDYVPDVLIPWPSHGISQDNVMTIAGAITGALTALFFILAGAILGWSVLNISKSTVPWVSGAMYIGLMYYAFSVLFKVYRLINRRIEAFAKKIALRFPE